MSKDKKTTADLITGKDCMAESCLEEMLYTKNLYNKTGGRQYIHIKFHSFLASLEGTHRYESLEIEAFLLYNIPHRNTYYKARGSELQTSATFRLNQYIKQCKCSCFKHT